jgi:hypothetical protein
VPWLETVYQRYKDDDFQIIGLTTVNRSSTDANVREFIDDNNITYPILKENGSARDHLNMAGTPFITLIRDGMLVWEHKLPTEQFPLQLVEQLLAAKTD